MGHIQHLFLESLVKMDHFQKEPPLNLKGPLAHKVEYPFSASAEQCPLLSESRHFVSPIEMLVYPGKLAGAATMGDLHKD